jgi:hypothetical protein
MGLEAIWLAVLRACAGPGNRTTLGACCPTAGLFARLTSVSLPIGVALPRNLHGVAEDGRSIRMTTV